MKINTNELEKLSIADMLAIYDYLSKDGKPSQIEIRIISALTYEIGERIAKLTGQEEPFDFKTALIKDGWQLTSEDQDECTLESYRPFAGLVELEIGDDYLNARTKDSGIIIFLCADIPKTEQEVTILFKLFQI